MLLCSNTFTSANNIYCTGHDACANKVWNGEYNIYCGLFYYRRFNCAMSFCDA